MERQGEPTLGDIRRRLDELVERRLTAGFSAEHHAEYVELVQLEVRALAEQRTVSQP